MRADPQNCPRRPAVFLDRDGTLNREVDYLSDPKHFDWLPGAQRALCALSAAGYALVVATNQSGIARGYLDQGTLDAIHHRMVSELDPFGVQFVAIESCPHHPEHGPPELRIACDCRKPAPGMLLRAANAHDLDLSKSWMVGDSLRDAQAGLAAGVRSILVWTGKGQSQSQSQQTKERLAIPQVPDLLHAAARILAASPVS